MALVLALSHAPLYADVDRLDTLLEILVLNVMLEMDPYPHNECSLLPSQILLVQRTWTL